MDGETLALGISLVSSLGTAGFFIIKWILKDRTETTNFDRSQIISTKEWLLREAALNKRIDGLELKIDEQREAYEKRLLDKNVEMAEKERVHREEIRERDIQIEDLKDQIRELGHQVKNVRQVQEAQKTN